MHVAVFVVRDVAQNDRLRQAGTDDDFAVEEDRLDLVGRYVRADALGRVDGLARGAAGGATTEAVQGMLMLLMQNLQAAFAGEPLKTPVPED